MIKNYSAVLFAVPKERTNGKGEKYERLEAYNDTSELLDLFASATKAGLTVTKVLPRVYEKDGENRIAMEISFFKGKPKEEVKA